jgi:hypothetical protein
MLYFVLQVEGVRCRAPAPGNVIVLCGKPFRNRRWRGRFRPVAVKKRPEQVFPRV